MPFRPACGSVKNTVSCMKQLNIPLLHSKLSNMILPQIDLAPITRLLRAKASSHLLVAAIHHFQVFEILSKGPLSMKEMQSALRLKDRPAMVLFPALCAMGLMELVAGNRLQLTEMGTYLSSGRQTNLVSYTSLEKNDPGVMQLTNWLRNDGPEDASQGLSYVKDDEASSPMDEPESAAFFTMALAGRARYLAPLVAGTIPKRNGHLLDVAGGTGYYTYEWLLVNPDATATILDRPEVLKIAMGLLDEFCILKETEEIKKRITFLPGNMHADLFPKADVLFAFSLFHDWPAETCRILAKKFAKALNPGGELWIHDAFLNDSLDGPLAVTDYSAQLFLGTKGRAYSRQEYRTWLAEAGLQPSYENIPTLMDYGLIFARNEG